jgi:CTP:molybdopterin cytidylyltransferase MocA
MMGLEVAAIVLAAGASARMGSGEGQAHEPGMGRPKSLLRLGSLTMLGHVLALADASGCSRRIVVAGAHPLRDPQLEQPRVTLIHNPDWPLGPLSSLQAGLRHALEVEAQPDAVLVLPVERPCVRVATVMGLLEGLAAEPGTLWQPLVYPSPSSTQPASADTQPRSGHPMLWPRSAFAGLLALDPRRDSARTLVRMPRWAGLRRFFACDDAGALDNIDDPEAYRALCARLRVSPDI